MARSLRFDFEDFGGIAKRRRTQAARIREPFGCCPAEADEKEKWLLIADDP
jgi:hypothetical protein